MPRCVEVMHGVPVQEIKLPDGRVFKVFSKCTVKMFVEKGRSHREKLRMELVDDSELTTE
jgi:hypothetical protein